MHLVLLHCYGSFCTKRLNFMLFVVYEIIETKSNTERKVFLCGFLIPAKPRLKVDWNSCAEVSGSRPSGATTCLIRTVEGGRDSRVIQNFGRKICSEGKVLLK